jgi:hypothetical protein
MQSPRSLAMAMPKLRPNLQELGERPYASKESDFKMQEDPELGGSTIVSSSPRRTQLCRTCNALTMHEKRNGEWYCTICLCQWC